jgi:two-component system cell cycle response regulator CpdR
MARIILAEDDDSMRAYLVRALERAGHDVKPFAEGLSAFEEIKIASFDLLLTDIVMPEMDGI